LQVDSFKPFWSEYLIKGYKLLAFLAIGSAPQFVEAYGWLLALCITKIIYTTHNNKGMGIKISKNTLLTLDILKANYGIRNY
jgi:hypothetical protein